MNDHSAPGQTTPARFSRPLTFIYLIAVVGFVVGAFLWAAKDDHSTADGALDLADVMLIVSWGLLVVAAVMTALRRRGARKA